MVQVFLKSDLRRVSAQLLVYNSFLMSNLSYISSLARQLALVEIEKHGLPHLLNFEISEKKALELADIL